MNNEQKSQLISQIDGALRQAIQSCRDANKLFNLARHYAQFHWLNLTECWEKADLENYIFKLIEPRLPAFTAQESRTKITHVISEAYDTGGHTPLCVNLVKEQKSRGDDVELIITRKATDTVIKNLQNANVPIKTYPDNGVSQMLALAKCFLQSKAVVLHINPDDIVVCLAVMIAERHGVPCYFVNHANIHFSYAPSQCTGILEITAASWLSSQKYRHPKSQSFLGIPASKTETNTLWQGRIEETGITGPYFISVGTPLKYRLGNSNDFPEFIEFLCGKMGQKLLMIGPGDHQKFAELSPDARKNLVVLGQVERDRTLALMAGAKAYIDSFPEGGGTSVVNAMKLGLPIFGCRISEGMYGDDFLSTSLPDLFARVSDFLTNGADQDLLDTRANFIKTQMSVSACVDRLLQTIDGKKIAVPYSYDTANMDLTFHHSRWLENHDLYIPPIINMGNTQSK